MSDYPLARQVEPTRVTRLDVVAFFCAVVTGCVGYALARYLGFGQLIQTSAVVIVMFLYAISVWVVPRLKVRLDQAGDNAYYLGLLFTLGSMAVALYEFRATTVAADGAVTRSGAEHIISNFGIALASTIVGIFLRVVMHQMRVDPAEVENVSRVELAESSKRVKANLDAVSEDMALFHAQIAQRMNDVVVTVTEDVRQLLVGVTAEVTGTATKLFATAEGAQNSIIQQTNTVVTRLDQTASGAQAAIERLAKVEPPPTKLASRLEKVAKSLEGLDEPIGSLTKSFESTSAASTQAIEKLARAAEHLAQFQTQAAENQARGLQDMRASAAALKNVLAEAATALQHDKTLLRELENQSKKSSEQAQRAQEAANAVIATLTGATRELIEVVRGDQPNAAAMREKRQ